ncbi:MAG: hypothetical protein F6K58_23945 [Symploca sp. SIO2E9]|nr:hypothetical protein [Symploca sp. SIO2E9]
MSKRVFLTLPDSVYENLEQWASSQGRPIANLAAFLVEVAVAEAEEAGKIPQKNESPSLKNQEG